MPGVFGTYDGSCAVCLTGTDTGVAFKGDVNWWAAGLIALGVPMDQAVTMAEGNKADNVMIVRVCADCVGASPFASVKPGLIYSTGPDGDFPIISHAGATR